MINTTANLAAAISGAISPTKASYFGANSEDEVPFVITDDSDDSINNTTALNSLLTPMIIPTTAWEMVSPDLALSSGETSPLSAVVSGVSVDRPQTEEAASHFSIRGDAATAMTGGRLALARDASVSDPVLSTLAFSDGESIEVLDESSGDLFSTDTAKAGVVGDEPIVPTSSLLNSPDVISEFDSASVSEPADEVQALLPLDSATNSTSSANEDSVVPVSVDYDLKEQSTSGWESSMGDVTSSRLSTPSVHRSDSKADVPSRAVPEADRLVLDQIISRFSVVRRGEQSHAQLDLEPRELGKLTMDLTMERDAVVVQFKVETPQVKEIIQAHLPVLRDALREQGLVIERFDVGLSGQGSFLGSDGYPRSSAENTAGSVHGSFVNDAEVELRVLAHEPSLYRIDVVA